MSTQPIHLEFDKAQAKVGLSIIYDEAADGSAHWRLAGAGAPLEVALTPQRIDEAHILYMQSSEILKGRAEAGENAASIEAVLRQLVALYQK